MRLATSAGLALSALAYLHWSYLALAAGLTAFGGLMLAQAVSIAAVAAGAWRARAEGALMRAFLVVSALELAGFLVFGDRSPTYLAMTALTAGGFAWMGATRAWRPGSGLVLAGMLLFLATSLVRGETFLLAGQLAAVAGWTLVALAAGRGLHVVKGLAQAGARP